MGAHESAGIAFCIQQDLFAAALQLHVAQVFRLSGAEAIAEREVTPTVAHHIFETRQQRFDAKTALLVRLKFVARRVGSPDILSRGADRQTQPPALGRGWPSASISRPVTVAPG